MSKEQLPVDAWMPKFVGDWLTGEATATMNNRQRGCFDQMLCWAWKQKGSLPNDPAKLAKFADEPEEWLFHTEEGQAVMAQWHLCEDGRLRNPKQSRVYEDAVERRRDKAEKATRAANTRWGRGRGGSDQGPPPPPPGQSDAPVPQDARAAIATALERYPTVVAWASTAERRALLEEVYDAVTQRHGARGWTMLVLPEVNFALQDGRKPEHVESGLRHWTVQDPGLSGNRLKVFLAGATRNARTVTEIESGGARRPALPTARRTAENQPARATKLLDA